jgi:hypothetical protein
MVGGRGLEPRTCGLRVECEVDNGMQAQRGGKHIMYFKVKASHALKRPSVFCRKNWGLQIREERILD